MQTTNYRLSCEDYVAYNQRLWVRRVGTSLAIVLLLIVAASTVIDGAWVISSAVLGALAGLVFCAVHISLIVPRSARAMYAEQASISERMTLAFDEQGLQIDQESGSFRSRWKSFVQWDETPRLLMLYVNRAMFIAMTKSEIGLETSEKIKQHLICSGLPKPMRRRRRT